MDKLLGTLSLSAIFRHVLSGGFFVGAYICTLYGITPDAIKKFEGHYAALGISSLFSGGLIYALHRGITNPLIERLRNTKRLAYFHCVVMPEKERDRLIQRWDYTKEVKMPGERIAEWGDYVHLLYTVSFALGLGSGAARWLSGAKSDWCIDWRLTTLAVLCFAAGFVTDCRKNHVEAFLYARAEKERNIEAGGH